MEFPNSRKTARLLLYPTIAVFVAALFLYLYSLPALQNSSGGAPGEAGAAGEAGFLGTAASDGNFFLTQLSVEAAGNRDENFPPPASDGDYSLSVQEISIKEAAPQ